MEKVIHLFHNFVCSIFFFRLVFSSDSLALVLSSNHQEVSPIFLLIPFILLVIRCPLSLTFKYTQIEQKTPKTNFYLGISFSFAGPIHEWNANIGMRWNIESWIKTFEMVRIAEFNEKKNVTENLGKKEGGESKSEYKSHCQSLFCGWMNSRIISN